MKILLVDDTELFLDLEKSYLDRSSFTILTARSGTEALDVIRTDRPTLVILDLLMPGMDGDEVCRKIKSDPLTNTIPIIMVSSLESRHRCEEAGCDAFVPKPLRRDDLLETIERTIVIAKRRYPRIPTHILSEVQKITDRVGIIREGVLVEIAQTGDLINRAVTQATIQFDEQVPESSFDHLSNVRMLRVNGDRHSYTLEVTGEMDGLIKTLAVFKVIDLAIHRPSLEEVFLKFYKNEAGKE